jgi:hypothetical protein
MPESEHRLQSTDRVSEPGIGPAEVRGLGRSFLLRDAILGRHMGDVVSLMMLNVAQRS